MWRGFKTLPIFMDKNKFLSYLIFLLIVLLPSIFIAILLFCSSYYIHEAGHIFFGFIDNLFHLKLISPYISNYVDCLFLNVPQQTRNIADSTLFALGGSLFSLLLFGMIAYYSNKRLGKSAIWAYMILISYSFREIIFNIIFGTDNFKHSPLMNLQDFPLLDKLFDYFVLINIVLTTLLFYSILRDRLKQKLATYLSKLYKNK
ncbi:hypothetical protein HYX08_01775 [Candidatus Woesearchaeota archaeon]|nr:hypothetical protein [Candidatus Woesearchaeota archaeon]